MCWPPMTRNLAAACIVVWAASVAIILAPQLRWWEIFPMGAAVGYMGAEVTAEFWRRRR